jgi:hypothetical protein
VTLGIEQSPDHCQGANGNDAALPITPTTGRGFEVDG